MAEATKIAKHKPSGALKAYITTAAKGKERTYITVSADGGQKKLWVEMSIKSSKHHRKIGEGIMEAINTGEITSREEAIAKKVALVDKLG